MTFIRQGGLVRGLREYSRGSIIFKADRYGKRTTKSAYNSEHLEAEKEIKNVHTEDIF